MSRSDSHFSAVEAKILHDTIHLYDYLQYIRMYVLTGHFIGYSIQFPSLKTLGLWPCHIETSLAT